MKSIITLLAITALSCVTSARAQDESPTASPASEEKASATVEAPSAPSSLRETSPSPSPEVKSTSTSSTVEKKESAAATSSASPSAKKTKASTETTEKTSTKKASTGADTGSAESNVKRLENEWEAAVMKKDPSFVQTRLAEDFIGTSSKGKRINKAALVKEFKNDNDTYSSAKNGGMTVRTFGSNVAVATGVAKEAGKSKDGASFNRTYAWTDTWMLRGSQWQCIGSQAMLVSGK